MLVHTHKQHDIGIYLHVNPNRLWISIIEALLLISTPFLDTRSLSFIPSLLPYKPWNSPEKIYTHHCYHINHGILLKKIYTRHCCQITQWIRILFRLFFLLLTCLKTVFIDRCLSFFFWSKYFQLLIIHLVFFDVYVLVCIVTQSDTIIRVITKLPNSEQSYKGKVKTHKSINRQNQSTTGKLWKP